jgi:hypothetical protein
MAKEKSGITHKIAHFFTHHPWLKLLALVLAVIVWFYVRGEMNSFNY